MKEKDLSVEEFSKLGYQEQKEFFVKEFKERHKVNKIGAIVFFGLAILFAIPAFKIIYFCEINNLWDSIPSGVTDYTMICLFMVIVMIVFADRCNVGRRYYRDMARKAEIMSDANRCSSIH